MPKFSESIELLKNNKLSIKIDPSGGDLSMGGAGRAGDIFLKNREGNLVMKIEGSEGNITAGGFGKDGDLFLNDRNGKRVISLEGDGARMTLGGHGEDGDVIINNSKGKRTIHLDGNAGDILFSNADFAEDFDILEKIEALPGHVMVLGSDGKLQPCDKAYDKSAVGVISGAGTYRPGIIMDKQEGIENRQPVAMMGKVFCMVDAEKGSIEVGDLLTTSSSYGHAMKVENFEKGFGTVIGKALQPLAKGKGLIPILVSLQ